VRLRGVRKAKLNDREGERGRGQRERERESSNLDSFCVEVICHFQSIKYRRQSYKRYLVLKKTKLVSISCTVHYLR
jgi:hypothetical protein